MTRPTHRPHARAFTALAVLAVLAADLTAQRRFPRRRPPGQTPPAQAPQPEAPKEDKPVEHWLAIRGADVYLGTGALLRRATVLVGDDKIKEVGHDLTIPEGATVIDASGKVVSPGFVIPKCRGLGAPGSPQGTYADEVNPFDPQIKLGLAAGITSFLASSGSGSGKPGGKSAVVKLSYGAIDGMVCRENTVYTMAVPLDPKSLRDLRKQIAEVREYRRARDAAAAEQGKEAPKPPRNSDELIAIMDGRARLWIGARANFDTTLIRDALEISELLGVGVVLDQPVTAWAIADEIAATDSGAIVSPRTIVESDPGRPDDTGSNFACAAILADAGVPVAVTTPSGRFGGGGIGTGGILGQDLNTPHIDAAYAVRGGMDNRQALRTLTLDAAELLGVADRVGSIEPGKDADLLILDGDPLHYGTFVETAIVNGKVVYEKHKEPFYSHIKR